jgi:branched-chain amino acid transport system substrate-binding protein
VVILAIDNDFGRGLAAVFRDGFPGPPPDVLHYPARGADFAGLAGEAEKRSPDGIYLVGYYNDMAALLREIRARSIPARILSTSSFGNQRTLDGAGESAEGVIYPAIVFDPEAEDPAVGRFVNDFRARHGTDPDLWAAHGYDAVRVLAAAIESAGGPVPDRIAEALLRIKDFPGATGPLTFDPEGDVVQYPRAFIVDQGRFILYRDYLARKRKEAGALPPVRPK